MTKVTPHARSVPWGMDTLGFLRSPEMLAPAGVCVCVCVRVCVCVCGVVCVYVCVCMCMCGEGFMILYTMYSKLAATSTHEHNSKPTHDASASVEHDGKNSLEIHHCALGVVNGIVWLQGRSYVEIRVTD